jgi:hypothetical protein
VAGRSWTNSPRVKTTYREFDPPDPGVAIRLAEDHADGTEPVTLAETHRRAVRAANLCDSHKHPSVDSIYRGILPALRLLAWITTSRVEKPAPGVAPEAQCRVLRDIFGNPFRPVAPDPGWRTSTVVALAQQMYEYRDFAAVPVLADALQDAGCDHPDVLDHCRGPGPHGRGCWVVDLVLGKE